MVHHFKRKCPQFSEQIAGFEEILMLIVADDELIFLETYVICFQKTVINDDDKRLTFFVLLSFLLILQDIHRQQGLLSPSYNK